MRTKVGNVINSKQYKLMKNIYSNISVQFSFDILSYNIIQIFLNFNKKNRNKALISYI